MITDKLKSWLEMAKTTTNDLLTLQMVFAELPRNTEQNTFFLKFIILVDLERQNKFSGNHASIDYKRGNHTNKTGNHT